jgi:hypothetical protein
MKVSRLEELSLRIELLEEELAKRSVPRRLNWLKKLLGISASENKKGYAGDDRRGA